MAAVSRRPDEEHQSRISTAHRGRPPKNRPPGACSAGAALSHREYPRTDFTVARIRSELNSCARKGVPMRPIQHDSYVAGIDEEVRTELVRNALQDRQARLISWREEAMGGGASGSELY